MLFHFIHYFGPFSAYDARPLPDERKLEIAKAKAAEDPAKRLLKNAHFKVNDHGDVEGWIEIP